LILYQTPRVIAKKIPFVLPSSAPAQTKTGTEDGYQTKIYVGELDNARQLSSKKKVEQWYELLNFKLKTLLVVNCTQNPSICFK